MLKVKIIFRVVENSYWDSLGKYSYFVYKDCLGFWLSIKNYLYVDLLEFFIISIYIIYIII